MPSPRLYAVLQSLSIGEYLEPLVTYGINSWDMLLEIQEEDLEALNFKLGHRRKLQREIAVSKKIRQLQEQLNMVKKETQTQQPGEVEDSRLPVHKGKRKRMDRKGASATNKRYDDEGSTRIETDRWSNSTETTSLFSSA